jgi:hypothetical protein
MSKRSLIKITVGKSPNEMGSCPFAPPWLRYCEQMNQTVQKIIDDMLNALTNINILLID